MRVSKKQESPTNRLRSGESINYLNLEKIGFISTMSNFDDILGKTNPASNYSRFKTAKKELVGNESNILGLRIY